MTDSSQRTAEIIIDEAQMILGSSGRVRLFFPGGPAEPTAIEYSETGRFVTLKVGDGDWIKVATAAIAGYQELA